MPLLLGPSRSIEMRNCWKSCHICASRSTGWLTWPASMLKATSCPMVRTPSITSEAPSHNMAAIDSRLISATLCEPAVPRLTVRNDAVI